MAFATGFVLVLLTAIARSYDQTLITEQPFRWLFGPLLFSFVSGTWLFLVSYGIFARWRMESVTEPRPGFDAAWLGFMGLFWLTAPVAWLYALPVERVFDSVTAAKVNVALLATVSLWRVLLIARVFQVLCGPPYLLALFWVLVPAAVEVLVVFFFGGAFGKALLAGMGGMRNSPEEEILLSTAGVAMTGALWTVPIALVLSLLWKPECPIRPLPLQQPGRIPWRLLTACTVFWMAIAIAPQRELAKNVAVERLVSDGQMREALDFLSARSPNEFAPARPLPPKAFERSVFQQLPKLFQAAQPNDAPWVREFLFQRLNEMCTHFEPRRRRKSAETATAQEIVIRFNWFGPKARAWSELLEGVERLPEGPAWLASHQELLRALSDHAAKQANDRSRLADATGDTAADWADLSERLDKLQRP